MRKFFDGVFRREQPKPVSEGTAHLVPPADRFEEAAPQEVQSAVVNPEALAVVPRAEEAPEELALRVDLHSGDAPIVLSHALIESQAQELSKKLKVPVESARLTVLSEHIAQVRHNQLAQLQAEHSRLIQESIKTGVAALQELIDQSSARIQNLETALQQQTEELKQAQAAYADQIKAKIDQEMHAQRQLLNKNVLLALAALSTAARFASGGHVILTALDMILLGKVTVSSAPDLRRLLVNNPLVQRSGELVRSVNRALSREIGNFLDRGEPSDDKGDTQEVTPPDRKRARGE